MNATPCVVSVADHAGWAHVVCVAAPANIAAVVERRRIALIDAGLPTLPYEHDTVGLREKEATALIARVRRSIAACTSRSLRQLIADLTPSYSAIALAIREPLFSELPETVAAVHESYRLKCAADGMMYQFALCHAADSLGLEVHQCRRGDEIALAAERLDLREQTVESFVRGSGRPPGPPWTAEHQRAFAAGIAVLAADSRLPARVQIR